MSNRTEHRLTQFHGKINHYLYFFHVDPRDRDHRGGFGDGPRRGGGGFGDRGGGGGFGDRGDGGGFGNRGRGGFGDRRRRPY